MNLNVKSEEARRMARELARATGQTITAAVTDAIRDRLAAVTATAPTAENLLAIGRDCAARLPEPWRSTPLEELLYDNHGLPR